MHAAVVLGTQKYKIGDLCGALVNPVFDVVGLGPRRGSVAVGKCAAFIAGDEGVAMTCCREPGVGVNR